MERSGFAKYQTSLFCEFDKYAAESYCAIHGVDPYLNIGDITKINEKSVPDFNTMFGGSPCQDFSVAGKQGGVAWTCKHCGHTYNPLEAHYTKRDACPQCECADIEKTRSSLLVEWLRFLREKKPRFAIYENVKNIVGARFRTTFDLFVKELDDYGYNVYWQVLNAKNFGIPQNRERVYCVIIRKDLDNGKFKFPSNIPLRHKLVDFLEEDVDERYYLSDERAASMISNPYTVELDKRGIEAEKYIIIYDDYNRRVKADQSCIGTVMPNFKNDAAGNGTKLIECTRQKSRVRKLTQKECWRLMGFDDQDFEKAKTAMNKNLYNGNDCCGSQLYKQAGNSIVVDVLCMIMGELYNAMPYLFEDIVVGSFFSGIGAFEKALSRFDELTIAGGNRVYG